jgi:hypothetical protein
MTEQLQGVWHRATGSIASILDLFVGQATFASQQCFSKHRIQFYLHRDGQAMKD